MRPTTSRPKHRLLGPALALQPALFDSLGTESPADERKPTHERQREHPRGADEVRLLGDASISKPIPPESKGARKRPSGRIPVSPQAKLLVSREEAAEILSISVRSIDYLIATKRLSTRRIGTRVLIRIEDVRKFARSDHPERMAG